jgi:hypothetical protein
MSDRNIDDGLTLNEWVMELQGLTTQDELGDMGHLVPMW